MSTTLPPFGAPQKSHASQPDERRPQGANLRPQRRRRLRQTLPTVAAPGSASFGPAVRAEDALESRTQAGSGYAPAAAQPLGASGLLQAAEEAVARERHLDQVFLPPPRHGTEVTATAVQRALRKMAGPHGADDAGDASRDVASDNAAPFDDTAAAPHNRQTSHTQKFPQRRARRAPSTSWLLYILERLTQLTAQNRIRRQLQQAMKERMARPAALSSTLMWHGLTPQRAQQDTAAWQGLVQRVAQHVPRPQDGERVPHATDTRSAQDKIFQYGVHNIADTLNAMTTGHTLGQTASSHMAGIADVAQSTLASLDSEIQQAMVQDARALAQTLQRFKELLQSFLYPQTRRPPHGWRR